MGNWNDDFPKSIQTFMLVLLFAEMEVHSAPITHTNS